MQEGRVADQRNPVLHIIFSLCLFNAVQSRNACAHTYVEIHNAQRRYSTQSIASDITCAVQLQFLHHRKDTAVRTSRTEDRRTVRRLCRYNRSNLFMQNCLSQHICTVFSLYRENFLADNRNSPGTHLLFDYRF